MKWPMWQHALSTKIKHNRDKTYIDIFSLFCISIMTQEVDSRSSHFKFIYGNGVSLVLLTLPLAPGQSIVASNPLNTESAFQAKTPV